MKKKKKFSALSFETYYIYNPQSFETFEIPASLTIQCLQIFRYSLLVCIFIMTPQKKNSKNCQIEKKLLKR